MQCSARNTGTTNVALNIIVFYLHPKQNGGREMRGRKRNEIEKEEQIE